MLTKEWWNVHDDTEQFVLRLQATSPTDLAFIKPEEVGNRVEVDNTRVVESYRLIFKNIDSR